MHTPPKNIRVLVVDDSAVARALLRELLAADPHIEVVAEAADGREALAQVARAMPDVVTMDLEMPVMGGIEAIAEIMSTHPVPILVVSSAADARNAYAAIELGALDVLSKPDYSAEAGAELVAKVRLLSTVPVIRHLRRRPLPALLQPAPRPAIAQSAPAARLFVLAASVGGPQVLARILGALPAGFPFPLLVSQHISHGFATGMATWLATLCKLPVQVAGDGQSPLAGTIYLSPSDANLVMTPARQMQLVPIAAGAVYHPSCDMLLESVALAYGAAAVGVILTGMGEDGARGMQALHQAGATTLAQDAASSVVFGMNRAAIARGAIGQVLDPHAIAAALCRLAGCTLGGEAA